MQNIAEPWNKFLETADGIEDKEMSYNAVAIEDVLKWFSEEVKFNGQPLGELLPIDKAIEDVHSATQE